MSEARPPGISVLRSAKNSRCLLTLLSLFITVSGLDCSLLCVPSLCNTSTLHTACIPYGPMQSSWDVAYCPSCLYSVYLLMLTVKLFACMVHRDDQCMDVTVTRTWLDELNCWENNGWWMSPTAVSNCYWINTKQKCSKEQCNKVIHKRGTMSSVLLCILTLH